MFTHILCPLDGSETSLEALDVAARLAVEQHAQLSILMAVDPAKAAAISFGNIAMSAACFDALNDEAKAVITEAAERVKETIVVETAVVDGPVVDSVLDYAEVHSCDLIVMGSHGRSGIKRALLGSVAEGIVRHASIPVMIIRRTKRAAKSAPAVATSAA